MRQKTETIETLRALAKKLGFRLFKIAQGRAAQAHCQPERKAGAKSATKPQKRAARTGTKQKSRAARQVKPSAPHRPSRLRMQP
jgi:hypothetical protein